jgi:hypothetical protein
MFVIHKYRLSIGEQILPLPTSAVILTMQEQNNQLVMWLRVPTGVVSQAMVTRTFWVAATGEDLDDTLREFDYKATAQLLNGEVYHLFEVVPRWKKYDESASPAQ